MIEVPDWEMTDECFVHIPDEQGGWVAVCFQDIFTESWQYLRGGCKGGLKSGHTRGHVRKGIKVPGCEICCGSS